MRFTPRASAERGEPVDPAHFTGAATSVPLHRTEAAHPVSVSLVRFPAGVRNHWHRHGGGQLLHAVEGQGWVQSRGAEPRRLRPGDSVSTAPGEEHWHGAGPGEAFAHVAVTIGEVEFLEPSPQPPPA
ncbi:MAG: cupin domain-containing protein [Candidatus Dormibacteraeota bacterium]|nr:cupin domain-containing protein [Candidatus Dormibacteraeota bacterium]